jgi:hypothetical protein
MTRGIVRGKPLDDVLNLETYVKQEHYALGVRSRSGERPPAGVTIPASRRLT